MLPMTQLTFRNTKITILNLFELKYPRFQRSEDIGKSGPNQRDDE